MIGASLLVLLLALDGTLGLLDGALLFGLLLAYMAFLVVQSRRETRQAQAEYDAEIQPAAAGALPTMFAASAPEAQGGGFYGPNGFGGMKGAPVAVAIKPAGQDLEAARRLWSVSEKLTGITWQDAFATKS